MNLNNASWVEWFWTIYPALGCIPILWLLWWRQRNVRVQEQSAIRNGKLRIARGRRRWEVVKLLSLGGLVQVGIHAMLTAPSNPNQPVTPLGLNLLAVFIVITTLCAIDSILSVIEQIRNVRDYKRKAEAAQRVRQTQGTKEV